jgi:hypothetical protein
MRLKDGSVIMEETRSKNLLAHFFRLGFVKTWILLHVPIETGE